MQHIATAEGPENALKNLSDRIVAISDETVTCHPPHTMDTGGRLLQRKHVLERVGHTKMWNTKTP